MCWQSFRYNIYVSEAQGKLKHRLFVIAGTVCAAIGVIGIFVPVLPTTPFLLLAAYCYMRGSSKLYNALLCNRFLGCYIKNYIEGRGMSLKMKVWTLSWLWIVLGYVIVFGTSDLIVRVILAIVLVGVTTHVVMIRVA